MPSGFHGKMLLACLNNSSDWQRTEAYFSGISRHYMSGPLDEEVYLARRSQPQEQSAEDNLQLDRWRPS